MQCSTGNEGLVDHLISSSSSLAPQSDEESLIVLLPSLRQWLVSKLGISDITPSTVSKFLSGGDAQLEMSLSSVLGVANEYKLGWFLLENIVSDELFKNFELKFQEKLFIRHLKVKFEMVLVELNFNINVLWRKCGCTTL